MAKDEKFEKLSLSSESYLYLHPGESSTMDLVSLVLDSSISVGPC